MTLTVGALWRYPVKTLAGERLDTIRVGDPVRLVRPTLEPPTERSDPDDQSR